MADRGINIDLVFRNGLRDYEVLPPAEVWDGIKPAIRKKQRPLILLRAAASVALLVSAGVVTYLLVESIPGSFNGPAITLNQEERPEGLFNQADRGSVPSDAAGPSSDLIVQNLAYVDVSPDPQPAILFNIPPASLYNSFISDKGLKESRNAGSVNRPDKVIETADYRNPGSLEEELSLAGNPNGPAKKARWTIGAMVTPSYYSRFSFGPDDAASELASTEKPAVSYTGGLSFAYNLSSRISIQTGLFYSAIGQRISGISAYSGFSQYINTKGDAFSVLTSSGTINTNNNDLYLLDNNLHARVMTAYGRDVFDPVKAGLKYIDNTINQNFSYLEIPFMFRYKLFDRNLDFNLIGGISYNMLLGNSAYTTSGGERYRIGSTEGLSPVTFSSSIGMGMEYRLSDKISLNMEPTIRYYLTPLGGLAGSSIHPYTLGILSGLSFKF